MSNEAHCVFAIQWKKLIVNGFRRIHYEHLLLYLFLHTSKMHGHFCNDWTSYFGLVDYLKQVMDDHKVINMVQKENEKLYVD